MSDNDMAVREKILEAVGLLLAFNEADKHPGLIKEMLKCGDLSLIDITNIFTDILGSSDGSPFCCICKKQRSQTDNRYGKVCMSCAIAYGRGVTDGKKLREPNDLCRVCGAGIKP